MHRRRSLMLTAPLALAVALLAGCTSTEENPEPTETETTATPKPTKTTTPEPTVISLPSKCDFAFADDQFDEFLASGLVLNPEFIQAGINDGSYLGAGDELRPLVSALNPTTCVWTPPAASDFVIIISYAKADEAVAEQARETLAAAGFAETTLEDNPLLDRVTPAATDDALPGHSEAHFFGKGIWVGVLAWNETSALPTITDTVTYLASK